MTRERLPNRRPNETVELTFDGTRYAVTIGYRLDRPSPEGFGPQGGRPGEVFTHGAKVGSTMDALLDDACVAISLLLQHDVAPEQLAASMGRLGDDRAPASILGALADILAAHQSELQIQEGAR